MHLGNLRHLGLSYVHDEMVHSDLSVCFWSIVVTEIRLTVKPNKLS